MARVIRPLLIAVTLLVMGLFQVSAAWALSAADLPLQPPAEAVFDQADVLSRATRSDLERRLELLTADHVEARLVTFGRLDYGLELKDLGNQLLERWRPTGEAIDRQSLLLLIETQGNSAVIVASPDLLEQLPPSLLESTADATMGPLLRDGARYRQASLDAIDRLAAVLKGGDDPGPPQIAEKFAIPTNIPSQEETATSNAFTWVIVLLVVGSIVPMLTWWVFSR